MSNQHCIVIVVKIVTIIPIILWFSLSCFLLTDSTFFLVRLQNRFGSGEFQTKLSRCFLNRDLLRHHFFNKLLADILCYDLIFLRAASNCIRSVLDYATAVVVVIVFISVFNIIVIIIIIIVIMQWLT